MRNLIVSFFLLLALAGIAACGSGSGRDAVSSHSQVGYSANSDCLICHSSQSSASSSLDPLATNGAGTAGKHVLHVTNRGIGCLKCHFTYKDQTSHMNGTIDTGNPAVHLVSFDSTNPSGQWTNDTGARQGTCSSLACHGPEAPAWYSAGSSLPACTTCHTGSLDPSVTNGAGQAGKHVLHATDRGIACEKCHLNYTNQVTHMNGTKDTENPAVNLVFFDSTNPDGRWINDTGPQKGTCGSVACHGAQNPDWYDAGSSLPACSACHTGSLDPAITNGTGTAGKHTLHVTGRGMACEKCHQRYTIQITHMNGTKDTTNPAVNLVYFDATNPGGRWGGDAGPQQGGCFSLACHGPENPDWYRAGSNLPDCSACHTGSLDPTLTNGSGASGKHTLHVTNRGIPCGECHQNYTDRMTHMNGTKDTPNPAVNLVYFDATNPSGSWIDDTGAQTGRCGSVACHGAQNPEWYGAGSNLPACTVCHSGAYDPQILDGPGTAGRHRVHYAEYHYDCVKCHYGYPDYSTHMNGTRDAQNLAVRIVYFDASNPAGQWRNYYGSQTGNCSLLYCHSDGTSLATGVINPGNPNTTPSWNASGPLACNSCHGNTQYADSRKAAPLYGTDNPKSNTHELHLSFPCNFCHVATTTDGISITNKTNHANGVYNVSPDTTKTVTIKGNTTAVNFVYTFDIGGGRCMNTSCHVAAGRYPNMRWGDVNGGISDVSTLCNRTGGCYEVICSATNVIGGTPPYTYFWDFGDGTTATGADATHGFSTGGQKYVYLAVRDVNHHLFERSNIPASPTESANIIPTAAKSVTQNGRTVTVTDLSFDPDYNTCGHSGPGEVWIWWNGADQNSQESFYVDFTDAPLNQSFSHTYTAPGTYWLIHGVKDNMNNYGLGDYQRSPSIQVVIP